MYDGKKKGALASYFRVGEEGGKKNRHRFFQEKGRVASRKKRERVPLAFGSGGGEGENLIGGGGMNLGKEKGDCASTSRVLKGEARERKASVETFEGGIGEGKRGGGGLHGTRKEGKKRAFTASGRRSDCGGGRESRTCFNVIQRKKRRKVHHGLPPNNEGKEFKETIEQSLFPLSRTRRGEKEKAAMGFVCCYEGHLKKGRSVWKRGEKS